jgi:hypothetical protein
MAAMEGSDSNAVETSSLDQTQDNVLLLWGRDRRQADFFFVRIYAYWQKIFRLISKLQLENNYEKAKPESS